MVEKGRGRRTRAEGGDETGERLGLGFLEVLGAFLYLCLQIFSPVSARLEGALLRTNRTAKDNKKQDHG